MKRSMSRRRTFGRRNCDHCCPGRCALPEDVTVTSPDSSLAAMSTVPPRRLVIATRESALAMWQANHIRARLRAIYPSCEIELLGMTTQGDRVLDQALADIGGKGLFIKELEIAMAEGRADIAVHS